MIEPPPPPEAFRALSARLGSDPLQIQGPGGNTSIKRDGVMWIKASGTELADAERRNVFVAVDLERARAEIDGRAGDGTCRAAVLDPNSPVRPSIETTFHALLNWAVVLHTHSVATLAHAVSEAGTAAALKKLDGLNAVAVPYRKPGLPLTHAIRTAKRNGTQVFILRNHGLIVCADRIEEADDLIREVESRLELPTRDEIAPPDENAGDAPEGWREVAWAGALAREPLRTLVRAGTLYPDHLVFLGPSVAASATEAAPEQKVAVDSRVLLRKNVQPVAETMLRCLHDVALRIPNAWGAEPIGPQAEAELMNWDAETYRQKLAGTTNG